MQWINRFVDELNNDKWVLPALKQIREICQLFTEAPQNYPHNQRTPPHVYYRNQVINQLQSQHSFVMLIAQNLAVYMNKCRVYAKGRQNITITGAYPRNDGSKKFFSMEGRCLKLYTIHISKINYVHVCYLILEHKDIEPCNIYHDGRFNHIQQVQERLKFLKFLLKDGQLWLCEPQAKQVTLYCEYSCNY